MKHIVIPAVLAAMSTLATAAPGALVTKVNSSGYGHPDWMRYEKCEIFADKLVVSRNFGASVDASFTVTEERPLTLSAGIQQVITNAATVTLEETPNSLCDGPSTYVAAQSAGAAEAFVLFSTGGCGSPRLERSGGHAHMLRDLIDLYCPKSHDLDGVD